MDHNKLRAPFSTEEVENNWAISYGDMITLLLGFFVIFFNIKTDTINLKLIKKDIDKHFKETSKDHKDRKVASVSETSQTQNVPIASSDILNRVKIHSNIEGERIIVEFPGVVFFHSGNHFLTKQGKDSLLEFSKAMDPHLGDFRLVVRGYTDSRPLSSGSRYEDNLELSAFRSMSAIRFLAKQGLALEKMRIAGFGESSIDRTLVTDKKWEEQRKVVIVVEPLDHTERTPESLDDKKVQESPSQAVEKATKFSVPESIPEVAQQDWPLDRLASQVKGKLNQLNGQIRGQWKKWDKDARVLEVKLEKNSHYQSFVDGLVYLDLRSKGYTHKKARALIKKFNQTQRKME